MSSLAIGLANQLEITMWIKPEDKMPDKGDTVTWIAPDGREVNGTCNGTLWFPEGTGMYIYYYPTLWKPREVKEPQKCNRW